MSGTWACTTADGVPVDCVNGPVREARFTPAAPFPVYHEEGTVYGPQWHVSLNPEHFLGVTDLAGNPFQTSELGSFYLH